MPRLGSLNSWIFLVTVLLFSSSTRADIPPDLLASMRCTTKGSAVVCFVTAKATPQSHVTYSRVDLIKAPSFLKVLVGSTEYNADRDLEPRLRLAFVAEKSGTGDVLAQVQAMVCADNGSSCPALSRAVTTKISAVR